MLRLTAPLAAALTGLAGLASGQSATPTRILPTLAPQDNTAPSLTPTILDPTAPDPQACPGYIASNVVQSGHGFTADLTIAGPHCQAFGNDIDDLTLEVSYQTADRLSVRIYPANIAPENETTYLLQPFIALLPDWDGETTEDTSDLKLTWTNEPTFQFKINRASTDEELFSTYGTVIVFEDQFLEVKTSMVEDYNVYGLAENTHDFLLGNNYTQVFYAADAGNTVDYNAYGTHPFYQETRYNSTGGKTTSHGVYARNAHGQEWLLREDSITYRTIGGSIDLYFYSGQNEDGTSSAKTTISQYQKGGSGLPKLEQYWTFGFHQMRWGYENISVVQDVVDNYRAFNIPMECLWNDLDIYDLYRDFYNNEVTYPPAQFAAFIEGLHADGQYYVPIIDSNIYAPNPTNASDSYPTYEIAAAAGLFIRDPTTGDPYLGTNWPGFSSWADWLHPGAQDWWTNQTKTWHGITPFDGIWIDLSEPSSFCAGSCGNGRLDENPLHPNFLLPGDPGQLEYRYPEGFNISNATEAASASSAAAAQSSYISANPPLPGTTTTVQGRTEPTPGVRNLSFPPYVINHVLAGHSLLKGTVAPNATHNDQYNTTEYELHNVFGLQISNATYYALVDIFPGKRPFTIGRSTFVGSGRVTGHWGGDNTSTWGSMFLSISQALTFMMAGIPMFGPDTCGFAGNTDNDLCSRWMSLSAFYPFYRNHNIKAAIGQEAYRWSSVAAASRNAMSIRYSLLTYLYTLMYNAHAEGETVMRALAWEFPEDYSLRTVYTQFLLGPSILVTPVLEPNVNYVRGIFPGIKEGTRWFDWYTLEEVDAQPGENVTLSAPIDTINIHVRGGSVLALQEPKYTTGETKNSSYSVLVAPGVDGSATGSIYLDDGVSLEPEETKTVDFSYADSCLTTTITGDYTVVGQLANVTVAGISSEPSGLSVSIGGESCSSASLSYSGTTVQVTGIESCTSSPAWESELKICLNAEGGANPPPYHGPHHGPPHQGPPSWGPPGYGPPGGGRHHGPPGGYRHHGPPS
ncbi:glycoside hydrolase family 31 protein [Polychaeton citri CBS 116435]|uniref:alpha-glucosidase n=1 Tax=Polychaeton citri CBS 116435 TaxID=1314669 RepID=A0A9P4PZ80_9PEZI|nr:glycoside hydrolase family 31 protein [Polychaeton citri CBS 116435]